MAAFRLTNGTSPSCSSFGPWRCTEARDSFIGVFNRKADEKFIGVIRRWRDVCREGRQRAKKI